MVCLQGPEKNRMETKKITLKIFTIAVIILLACEIVMGLAVSSKWLSVMAIIGIGRFVEILLLLVLIQLTSGLSAAGLGREQLLPGLIRGFRWSAGFGGVVLAAAGIMYLSGLNPLKMIHTRLPEKIPDLMLYFLVGGLIAPAAEEILFRGVMFGYFRKWDFVTALILSTLLFAAAHSTAGVPVTQIIGGLLFTVSYEKEKMLLTPITIHVLGNSAIFFMSLIA